MRAGESLNEAMRGARLAGRLAQCAAASTGLGDDLLDSAAMQQHWLRLETARHIEEMLCGLGAMARSAELRHLFYLIELARLEAGAEAEQSQPDR